MGGKTPKDEVKALDQGDGRGILVPISASHCREAGVDPDGDVRVKRYVFDTDRAEVRLRLRDDS